MLTATMPETKSESLTELRARWKELLPAAQQVAKQTGELKTLAGKLSTPEGYEALKKLQKDLARLRQMELETDALMRQARAAGEQVEEWLAQEWDRRGTEFGNDLMAYFQDRAIPVELDGATLKAGLFHITIEPQKDRAVLRYLDEDMVEMKLSCEKIFKAWQSANERMEKAAATPAMMAANLVEAYDDVCRAQSKSAGTRVRLPDLHFQLFVARQTTAVRQDPRQSKVKDYPRYQFAYDLSVMLERLGDGLKASHDGRHLTFHQASKSSAGSRANSIKVEADGVAQALSDLEISD